MINYGKHKIDDDDISAVLEVLKSDFLTMGPKVPEFEQDLKEICGATYCTVVTNATAALHLSMIAFGIEQNDHVWTTPVSFVATAKHCNLMVFLQQFDQIGHHRCFTGASQINITDTDYRNIKSFF